MSLYNLLCRRRRRLVRTSPKSYRSRLFQVTNSKFLFSKFSFIQEIWMNVFFYWPMNMWHRGYSRVCTDELSISDRHSRYSQFRPNNNSGMRGLTTWNKNSSNIIRLFQTRQNWQYRHQRLYYMKIKKIQQQNVTSSNDWIQDHCHSGLILFFLS